MNFASVGRLQCRMHWGNTALAVRKGEERATFAQLLQSNPRPVGEVLLDALHNADVAMRDMRAQLVAGEPVTVDTLDRFINLSRLTHHLAKTTVDAGVLTKLVEQQRVGLEEIGEFVAGVLITVLDAVPLHPAWRQYLLEVAEVHMLEVARTSGTSVLEVPAGPERLPPTPPDVPILRPKQGSPPID
jgi:hypothetical protein